MSSSMVNALNTKLRMTGMSSGLDTDTLISDMLRADRAKIDKVNQNNQTIQWKREDYRSITNLLRSFKDTYMDLLNPSTNMRSSSAYSAFKVTSSNSTGISATAISGAVSGSHTIKATQLATAANTTSGTTVTKAMESSSGINFGDFAADADFKINLNGQVKTITISGGAYDIDSLRTELQNKINTAFGAGKISIGKDGTDTKLTFDAPNSVISLSAGTSNDALVGLNMADGSSNRLSLSSKLSDLNTQTALSGTVNFKINGVDFNFDAAATTLSQVISQINGSSAGVTLAYSQVTDKFTLTSNNTGSGAAISIENISGDFFGAGSAVNITNSAVTNGTDAVFDLDGTTGIVRSSNTFNIDGVEYTLKETGATATIGVQQDVDAVVNNIKAFIGKYNELIDTLNGKLTEERFRGFQPLTDEQKDSMKDADIEKWEAKAKSGLLRNDSMLSPLANSLKMAAFELVDGLGTNLSAIGISTTKYTDKGKLTINEAKLREAIQNTPDKVMNLFSKESSISYSPDLSQADRNTRYTENGFVNRVYDIIQNNIRTTRDSSGKKGSLLEKAGIAGDVTEYVNSMNIEISNNEKLISELQRKLLTKEDNLYAKFARMESALNQMSKQTFWMQQQMGGQ